MQFPVNLNLHGRPVLVVGGGRIALRKVEQLLMADAEVTVLSPIFVDEFTSLPVTLVQREYASGDVDAFRLVITATGNTPVDQQIFDECEAKGIWINSADDPDRCAFTLPAALRRGDLMVTVSTGGASPALASWLRSHLELSIVPEFEEVVSRLAIERARIHAQGESTENVQWQPIIAGVMADLGMTCPVVREVETAQ
ncbi:MAG: bifunctional precorrin-2 dehydrogenase/sirohydrochlorin ferrochelatase [Actinobacteria bacterium]|uniref:precorrin-2 dehydrogenase n=1 Tax=freshwater metagenome TaxID=449393 RepID=A0A6J7TWY4_9ZZZZ|nr:bifunctional precorrin-2 dehydrogenase/sirohydrochlorin ferrochelatase [Actinomycetota bacterium]